MRNTILLYFTSSCPPLLLLCCFCNTQVLEKDDFFVLFVLPLKGSLFTSLSYLTINLSLCIFCTLHGYMYLLASLFCFKIFPIIAHKFLLRVHTVHAFLVGGVPSS